LRRGRRYFAGESGIAGVAQHPDQLPEGGQSGSSLRAEGYQGIDGGIGLAAGAALRRPGLDDHPGQVVGDRVVQLAGDPQSFLAGRVDIPVKPLLLQPPGSLLQSGGIRATGAYDLAQQ